MSRPEAGLAYLEGRMTATAAARACGMSRETMRYRLKMLPKTAVAVAMLRKSIAAKAKNPNITDEEILASMDLSPEEVLAASAPAAAAAAAQPEPKPQPVVIGTRIEAKARALALRTSGMSLRKASEAVWLERGWRVSHGTLLLMEQDPSRVEPAIRTTLPQNFEVELKKIFVALQARGVALTSTLMLNVTQKYLANTPFATSFVNGRPSHGDAGGKKYQKNKVFFGNESVELMMFFLLFPFFLGWLKRFFKRNDIEHKTTRVVEIAV